jgi:hypothetical protein
MTQAIERARDLVQLLPEPRVVRLPRRELAERGHPREQLVDPRARRVQVQPEIRR